MAVATACPRRLSLLQSWLQMSGEYVAVVLQAMKSRSAGEHQFLRAVIADTRSQMKAARRRLDVHRARLLIG